MRVRSPLKLSERETITTPSASIPTNSRPMAVSPDSRERRRTTPTPAIIDGRADDRPADARQAQQDRPGDARQHAVGERVADEREAAQHDEGADDRARDGHEAAGDERPQHELVVEEGVDERAHGAP